MDLTEFTEKHQALTTFLASNPPGTKKGAGKIAEEIKEIVEPLNDWLEDLRARVAEAKQSIEDMDEWVEQLAVAVENIESGADELEEADSADREEAHSNLVAEAEAILSTLEEIGVGADPGAQ